jgi:hypothetical protein
VPAHNGKAIDSTWTDIIGFIQEAENIQTLKDVKITGLN